MIQLYIYFGWCVIQLLWVIFDIIIVESVSFNYWERSIIWNTVTHLWFDNNNDNDNDLFIILTGIHKKYAFFDMLQ